MFARPASMPMNVVLGDPNSSSSTVMSSVAPLNAVSEAVASFVSLFPMYIATFWTGCTKLIVRGTPPLSGTGSIGPTGKVSGEFHRPNRPDWVPAVGGNRQGLSAEAQLPMIFGVVVGSSLKEMPSDCRY
jgi:hypothetical protein